MDIDTTAPLPADTDLDRLLERRIPAELSALIETYDRVEQTQRLVARLAGKPDDEPDGAVANRTVGQMRDIFLQDLARYAKVTPLHALRANSIAAMRLSGSRYVAIRGARANGQSWSAIGAALGMSKQGAQDWYNNWSTAEEKDSAPAE